MAASLKVTGIEQRNLEKIRKLIGPECACFVLITCTAPSDIGKMDVELHFEGDESLAGLIVENATEVFNSRK